MIDIYTVLLVAGLTISLYVVLRALDSKIGTSLGSERPEGRGTRLDGLKNELEFQRKMFARQLAEQSEKFEEELKKQKKILEDRITILQRHNEYLLERLLAYEDKDSHRINLKSKRLLFVSLEPKFHDRDRNSLFRAGVNFTTLKPTAPEAISREIRRARQQGTPYSYVMISGHGNDDGVVSSFGNIPGEWWGLHLSSKEIVMFGTCSSLSFIDDVVGSSSFVIGISSDVETELVEDFVYIFWREISDGLDALAAYEKSRSLIPEISDKIVIRYEEENGPRN